MKEFLLIKIIPKADKVVIDPFVGKQLPISGKVVKKLNTYWKNREKDGDIIIEVISKKTKEKGKK